MLTLIVYIPASHLEQVKEAMFAAGAGRIGNYDHCAWQTLGEGQFRALPGAHPAIGEVGKVEKVPEWKVELVCEAASINAVIAAMKAAHPYETPAYHVSKPLEF